MQSAFAEAVSGHGRLAVVVGEPGIGKTALTERLGSHVEAHGGRLIRGHCYEEGSLSLPYLPFIEALQQYIVDLDPEQLGAELGSDAGLVSKIIPELRQILGVEPPEPTSPEEDRFRLLEAVTNFLRGAAPVFRDRHFLFTLEQTHGGRNVVR